MKHLWGALLVLALSAFMPSHLSGQGVSTQTGRARGAGLELGQNYPNPFNPKTVISYQLAVSSFASLKIYDILGNEIATLVNQNQNAGMYSVEWNAGNFSSGVYFYKLETDGFTDTKRMMLLK